METEGRERSLRGVRREESETTSAEREHLAGEEKVVFRETERDPSEGGR